MQNLLFTCFSLFVSLAFGQISMTADDYLPYINKAKIVIDGVGENSYCYKSRSGEVFYIIKFHVNNIYKGRDLIQLGDIYIVQNDRSGMTQDGSGVSVQVDDGNDANAIDVTGVNVLLTACILNDSTKLPKNYSPLSSNPNVLIAGIVISTFTSDRVSSFGFHGAKIGRSKFISVDSLYKYLNNRLGFIDRKEYEPKESKIQFMKLETPVYGASKLTSFPSFIGGIDSLNKYVKSKLDKTKVPVDYRDSTPIKFVVSIQTSSNGDVENVSVLNGLTREINEEIVRIIITGPKFVPAKIQDENVRSKITFVLDI